MNKEITETKKTPCVQYSTTTPSVFVNETKEGYEITFEIPGVGKDDVTLNIENRTLTLTTGNSHCPPEGLTCVSREFPVYNYAVSLDLPEHADTGAIKATVANGILTAKLSKRAELQPRKIEVSAE
ncbi:MAG: Hsp20/alpha crystallin family protein [Kiritimatiellia bacterium]|jgi:HSP20 family protein